MSRKGLCIASVVSMLVAGQLGDAKVSVAAGREETFIRKGVELRRKGQDKEALANFQKAYEVSHTARAAAQLGLCEQALKQWLDAYNHLSDALASQSDVWISEHRSTLEKSFAETQRQLGRVEVKGSPESGVVVIAGEVVGKLGENISVPVLPGSVTITVTADGYTRSEEVRQVMAGQSASVTVSLKKLLPLSARIATPDIQQSPGVANEPSLVANGALAQPQPSSGSSGSSKIAAYSAFGLGGAVLVAGGYFALRSSSLAKQAREADVYDAGKDDSAKSASTISLVCFGAGVVSLGVGTFLYLRTGENSEVALAPHASGDGATVAWKGRF